MSEYISHCMETVLMSSLTQV